MVSYDTDEEKERKKIWEDPEGRKRVTIVSDRNNSQVARGWQIGLYTMITPLGTCAAFGAIFYALYGSFTHSLEFGVLGILVAVTFLCLAAIPVYTKVMRLKTDIPGLKG